MILTGYVLLCAIGLILLYFGADFLIKGGGSIARTLKVPSLIIGLTLVALTGEIYEHRLHSVRYFYCALRSITSGIYLLHLA